MVLTGGTVQQGTVITAGSGTTWSVSISQTATCTQATFQTFFINAEINDTVLTFTDYTGQDPVAGLVLSGTGVIGGTYLISGSDTTWTVSTTQTTVPTTITATPVIMTVTGPVTSSILLGQQIAGSGITSGTKVISSDTGVGNTGTYYVTPSQSASSTPTTSRYIYTRPTIIAGLTITGAIISGTTLTFSGITGGDIRVGMRVTGSNVAPGTTIVSGASTSWQVNISQAVSNTTLLITGNGAGGIGTYIVDQILPAGITVTNAISLVINHYSRKNENYQKKKL
jgi:hypothetical protein